jgi:hypothetical protein
MLCIDRLTSVLGLLADDGSIEFQFVPNNVDVIEIKDLLYGTGRFTITAEIIAGRDVLLLTKLFPPLEGDAVSLNTAYLYLLNLNAAGHGVTIGIDINTGAVGATVMFKCDINIGQLKIATLHNLCIITRFMETYYDALLGKMLELGVIGNG